MAVAVATSSATTTTRLMNDYTGGLQYRLLHNLLQCFTGVK